MGFRTAEALEDRFIEVYGDESWFHSTTIIKEDGVKCVEVRVNNGMKPYFTRDSVSRLFKDFESIPPYKIVNRPMPVTILPAFFDWQETVGM